MNVLRLVCREIWHRKLNFLVSLLAIIVLVGYAVGALTLIRAQRERTEQRVAALDDEIRKITKSLGFNINILPADQNLADFHANDFGEKTMPFEYVQRLAESPDIVTINHLRPALIRKIEWQEQQRQIVLMGVAGVIPWTHRSNPKKPMTEAVPTGTLNIGSVLAEQLQLQEGDTTQLNGLELKVNKIYPERGTKDDITVWIDLQAAQNMLELPDQINLIQALECNCASVDRLAEIEGEISQVLGSDVQVIELATKAIARARARVDVQAEGQITVARMQDRATLLLVLLVLASSILVGLLALLNVWERQQEIGILRAIGTSTGSIMWMFLLKALFVGLIGAIIGYLIGFGIAVRLDEQSANGLIVESLFDFRMMVFAILLAPIITIIASWVPAVFASNQDPATVLSME
ncbi:MAG: hypothetical protein CMJ77_21305 [Planctomycetaceae bacterium]|nr:hypothetical protein [Planctomycetaceae bacterium]